MKTYSDEEMQKIAKNISRFLDATNGNELSKTIRENIIAGDREIVLSIDEARCVLVSMLSVGIYNNVTKGKFLPEVARDVAVECLLNPEIFE